MTAVCRRGDTPSAALASLLLKMEVQCGATSKGCVSKNNPLIRLNYLLRTMNEMKSKNNVAAVTAAMMGLAWATTSAHALNITINDTFGAGGSGQGREVGETEPGTINNHSWDNEAVVIKGNKLVLVSGFNFMTGNSGFASGDLFLNTSGGIPVGVTLSGGNGYRAINNNLGYEYVLDLSVGGGVGGIGTGLSYNVVNLTTGSVELRSGFYRQNDQGNPFAYVSGGTVDYANQGMTYRSGLSTAQVLADYGLDITTSGEANYALELDMSWFNAAFPNGTEFSTHYTMGCANDVLVGQASGGFDRVPEGGSTMLLLGFGLSGLGLVRARFARKA